MMETTVQIEDIKPAQDEYYYWASPYSKWPGGPDDAAHMVARIAGEAIKRGVSVYSPIAHSHAISRAANIDVYSHEIWLPADKPIAHHACGMIICGMPGWRDSYGIGEEIRWFKAHKKPIYLLDFETLVVQILP